MTGSTPLHDAAEDGKIEVAKLLIESGALVDAKDNDGFTPLHIAAVNGKLESAKCLIENGANVTAKTTLQKTPLYYAAKNGEVEVAKLLIANGALVDAKTDEENTPLHIAAYKGHRDFVKFLIENGATIDIKSMDEITPLHIAVRENKLNIVKCLVENGAKINPQNLDNNQTPCFIALKKDFKEVADYLTKIKKRKAEDQPREIFDSKDPCVLCFEPRNEFYVLLPCGHTSLCETCCMKITCKDDNSKCPSCRKPIKSYTRIFLQKPE